MLLTISGSTNQFTGGVNRCARLDALLYTEERYQGRTRTTPVGASWSSGWAVKICRLEGLWGKQRC
jgi:hypothetical protein